MRPAAVVLVGTSAGHTASAQKVTIESDPGVNFAALKTFVIREGVMRSPNPVLNTDLMNKRIEADITQALSSKG